MNTFTSIAKRLPAIRAIKQHATAVKGAQHYETAATTIEDRYLNLLKRCLTRYGLCREYGHVPVLPGLNNFLFSRRLAFVLSEQVRIAIEIRHAGLRPWIRHISLSVRLRPEFQGLSRNVAGA